MLIVHGVETSFLLGYFSTPVFAFSLTGGFYMLLVKFRTSFKATRLTEALIPILLLIELR